MNLEKVFLTVLNMTFTASFVIAVIIITRLFLNKMPKFISYVLWIAAGFRLVFPFSVESVLGLIRFNPQPIPQDILEQSVPYIDTGISAIDNAVGNILPMVSHSDASVSPLQTIIIASTIIWLVGVVVMLIYSRVSMLVLKRKLKNAVLIENNIYEANVKTPFVTGFFKPKIYIPTTLTADERDYIILHERTHIKRRDNFIKLFSYIVLSLHWFNPLVWAAFILMSMDMEMSCDESVLSETGKKTKKAYSQSILSLATERHTINIYPLAFGGGNTIRRIKNVLNYKKQSKIKIAISFILVAVLTVGFMLNNTISVAAAQENDDFKHAAEFLAKNALIRVIAENDILTGEDNLTRKDLAFYVARLLHPKYDFKDKVKNDFFGTKPGTYLDMVIGEDGKFTSIEKTVDDAAIDFNKKLYDFSIKYCKDNGIMDSKWLSVPDATVTLNEAVKILVTALGYDGIADDEYLAKAATGEVRLLGKSAVFQFAGVSADKILTKNDAIMLLYNFIMSDYATDVKGTVMVLDRLPDKIIDENLEIYLRNSQNFSNMANYPYNLNITRDEYIKKVLRTGMVSRQEYPITYKAVLNTFGAYMAKPTESKVTVDGKEIIFDAYNIDGSNYFRLQDISHVLKGTTKQFGRILEVKVNVDGTSLVMPTAVNMFIGEPNTQAVHKSDNTWYYVDGSINYKMSEKGKDTVTATKGNEHSNGVVEFIIYSEVEDSNKNAFTRVEHCGVGAYEINVKGGMKMSKNGV